MDSQTLNQIRNAIKQALDRGLSKEEIREFMVNSGYSETDVDETFSDFKGHTAEELRQALSELEEPEIPKQTPKEKEPKAFESGKKVCPKCGFINSPTSKFCGGCGEKL